MGNGGWRGGDAVSSRIKSPLNTYGGTDQSSTWVYACVTIRSQQLAAYPWWLHAPGSEHDPIERTSRRGEVAQLYAVLDEPNSEMSYFDLAEQVEMDLCLTGDSFWLCDGLNPLGQPNALEWLMPGTVKVVTDDQGRRKGYVYQPKDTATPIPYALSEVIHFRNRNPLNRYYGMGVVEAILRSIDRDLAQGGHVTAFFDQGAHLSGVLTVPETIGEEEFERMKRQYEQEFRAANNRFNVLIAEGAQSYTPITSTPGVIGTVDLSRLSKDEILSGFGVPEFLLGGTGQGGVYKMEEAQNILHRAMIPVSGRFARRIKMDLAGRYFLDASPRQRPIGFHVDPRQSDTPTAKVDRARKMVGTGASIDMILEMAGQARLNWPNITDVPLIPSGLVPVTKDGGFGLAAGSTGPSPPPNSAAEEDPNNKPGGDGDANKPEADSDQDEDGSARRSAAELADQLLASVLPTLPLPWAELPYEQVLRQTPALRQAWEAEHMPAQVQAVDDDAALRAALRDFLVAQRTRAIDHVGQYGVVKGANLQARPRYRKDELDPATVLDQEAELADLRQRLDALGLALPEATCELVVSRACAAVTAQVAEGLRRGLSVAQLAAGFPMEGYRGIVGVFDDLMADDLILFDPSAS